MSSVITALKGITAAKWFMPVVVGTVGIAAVGTTGTYVNKYNQLEQEVAQGNQTALEQQVDPRGQQNRQDNFQGSRGMTAMEDGKFGGQGRNVDGRDVYKFKEEGRHGSYGSGVGIYEEYGQGQNGGQMGGYFLEFDDSIPTQELSQDAIDAMLAALDDENKAHTVYEAVINEIGRVRPFTNIMRAEQMHIDALVNLFERYSVEYLASQYNATDIEVGDTLAANCQIGVDAEVANADLYVELLKQVDGYDDVILVFEHLRDASQYNHLPSFERCAN